MRASTYVVAFAATAFAAGVDKASSFNDITSPQGVDKAVAAGKLYCSSILSINC